MLPTPVSSHKRESLVRRRHRTVDLFRRPARLTNLGVFLLAAIAAISLLLNLKHYISSESDFGYALPGSLASTLVRPAVQNLTHLIIVPGHGIWTGAHARELTDESAWVLAPYQRGKGRPAVLLEHIARGVELTLEDDNSLLVFSGGQTSPLSTTTEAESYHRLAIAASLLPSPTSSIIPFTRATTEPFALDSYQNLMFSIARFREFTGVYPRKITIVGYQFKRRRFEELHRVALRWSPADLEYVGLSLGGTMEEQEAFEGEPYSADLYGCHPPLSTKRASRNPHGRIHAYHTSAPELRGLLEWCPASRASVFTGALPWDGA